MRIQIFSAILALFCFAEAQALELTASGDLFRSIGRADLLSGAGGNLNSTFTDTGVSSLTVSGTAGPGDNWRIEVRRAASNWHPALRLLVRRVGEGSGNGFVEGGTSFIDVTDGESVFLRGAGDRSGIVLSYQLTGVGVHIPPGAYSTAVLFTVVDTP